MYGRCIGRLVRHEVMRQREQALLRAACKMPEVQLLRSLPLKGTTTELQRRCARDVSSLLSLSTDSDTIQASVSSSSSACDSRAVQEVFEFTKLGPRFDNVADGVKGSFEEASLEVIDADLSAMWHNACQAYKAIEQYTQRETLEDRTNSCSDTVRLPSCVLYLVLYSHTRQGYAVGRAMCAIRDQVRSLVYNNKAGSLAACASILRVLTVGIGVTSPHSERAESSTAAGTAKDEVWYSRAGLYTLNATLQSLGELAPLQQTCQEGKQPAAVLLKPKVFVLSEAWLQPRTVVAMHERVKCATAFAPLHTVDKQSIAATEMHVVPGVVHDRLSEVEIEAFARYIVCRALR